VNAERVLFVIDYFRDPHAGTEGQLYSLVQGLDRQAFTPHLLVFEESPWLRQHGFPCDYTVLGHRSLKSPATWRALFRTARRFRQQGYRLAHIFFNDPSLIGPPVFRLCGIRSLLSRRDMGYWYTPALKACLRVTGRFAEGVVANSDAVRRVTMAAEGFREQSVHVIYNGFPDNKAVGSSPGAEVSPLSELRKGGRILMGLVANIRPIKRIPDALGCLALLKNKVPELDLVVIGAGDGEPLRRQAEALGIAGRVHLLGPRDDVANCLPFLDMGILCSESEGFSNAIVEYLRAGLPVVCSEVGGNPEAISDGVNGYVYPVGDVTAFAKVVCKLAGDPELRAEMATRAKKDAEERYSMSRMVTAHEALYQRVLGSHGSVAESDTDGSRS